MTDPMKPDVPNGIDPHVLKWRLIWILDGLIGSRNSLGAVAATAVGLRLLIDDIENEKVASWEIRGITGDYPLTIDAGPLPPHL